MITLVFLNVPETKQFVSNVSDLSGLHRLWTYWFTDIQIVHVTQNAQMGVWAAKVIFVPSVQKKKKIKIGINALKIMAQI